MFNDEPVEPVKLPIDPAGPLPEFPGKLPRELSVGLRDQLQEMAEAVYPYLGPDHPVIAALDQARRELTIVTYPKTGRYAEYTPEE
jgi:hypothetical protein